MSSIAYSGPIEHVVVVMLARRSYDDGLGALYDAANAEPYDAAPGAQRKLDGAGARGFRPPAIPVTAYLARQFMVCDRWFASSPRRGAANLLFAHCAADGDAALEPNVFSALDATRPPHADGARWKIYFHDDSLVGRALPYVARCWSDPANGNLANYDEVDYPPGRENVLARPTTTFLQDVAQNRLPAYAFVEPRRGMRRSPVSLGSERPAEGAFDLVADPFDDEALVCEVYLALRTSAYWERSLLLVVYGESDASADHVAPPAGWGGRVPAIVVSPYVEPGSILRADAPFEHASIVKTLWQCFDLRRSRAPHATARDERAPSLLDHLATRVVNRPAAGLDLGDLLTVASR